MGPRSSPLDLVRGFAYPFRGYGLVRRHRELARYWVPPIVIVCAGLASSVWLAARYHASLLAWLWPEPMGTDGLSRVLVVVHHAAETLAFVAVTALLFVVSNLLSSVVAAPFNDALSEVVEELACGQTPKPTGWARAASEVVRAVRIEVFKLTCYALIMGPLFVVSWVFPGVGHALYVVVGSLFTAAYLALDYVDWPAARRGRGVRERLRLVRERPWLMLGFGCAVWLFLLVPLMNLWFMPAAVAGGTLLFLDLERQDRPHSP